MKAKIISHEIKEVDGSTILYMIYSYKGFKSPVSIIDIPDCTPKAIKQYIKTAEKAINIEIREILHMNQTIYLGTDGFKILLLNINNPEDWDPDIETGGNHTGGDNGIGV